MTTEASAATTTNVEALYPLLKRAQDLGAPLEVFEPDYEGDVKVIFSDLDGDAYLDTCFISDDGESLAKSFQYTVMGVLMDWLERLFVETAFASAATLHRNMAKAWSTGGFVAMLETFNDQGEEFGVDECARDLKAKLEREAEAAKPSPESKRIKELEGQLAERNTKLKRLRAIELLLFNEVEQVDESLGSYVITVKKRMSILSLMGSYPSRIDLGLSIGNEPEAQS